VALGALWGLAAGVVWHASVTGASGWGWGWPSFTVPEAAGLWSERPGAVFLPGVLLAVLPSLARPVTILWVVRTPAQVSWGRALGITAGAALVGGAGGLLVGGLLALGLIVLTWPEV
jgi:hypothetical protein